MENSKNIFPGNFIDKPIFQSLKNLRRLLSEQDSCFHANQVSIAFLEDYIKSNGVDNSKYIAELCNKYSISGGHRNWEVTKILMARSYIVQTYNIQEIFFKEFNSEFIIYKNVRDWKFKYTYGSSTKNLDPYSQLIENIPQEQASRFKKTPESLAIQYYRLVRNDIVHPLNTSHDKSNWKDSFDKSKKFYKINIEPILKYFKGYYKFLINDTLPAPNSPDNLNHYDFTIYSRCLKNLANLINNSCNLTIAEIFNFEISNEQFVSGMNRYNPNSGDGTKQKLLLELSNFFKTKYGNSPSDINLFIQTYLEWIK